MGRLTKGERESGSGNGRHACKYTVGQVRCFEPIIACLLAFPESRLISWNAFAVSAVKECNEVPGCRARLGLDPGSRVTRASRPGIIKRASVEANAGQRQACRRSFCIRPVANSGPPRLSECFHTTSARSIALVQVEPRRDMTNASAACGRGEGALHLGMK